MSTSKNSRGVPSTDMADRLLDIIAAYGLSESKIGVLTNRTKGVIYSYTLREAEIPREFIEKLKEAIPSLHIEWFTKGTGKMASQPVVKLSSTKNFCLPKGVDEGIIDRLRLIRGSLGLNQKIMAEEMSITPDLQRNIEARRQNPTIQYMKLLKGTYQVNLNFLIEGEGNMFLAESESRLDNIAELELRLVQSEKEKISLTELIDVYRHRLSKYESN